MFRYWLIYYQDLLLTIRSKYSVYAVAEIFDIQLHFKPLKTKRRRLYLNIQFVPRSKHFSSRL